MALARCAITAWRRADRNGFISEARLFSSPENLNVGEVCSRGFLAGLKLRRSQGRNIFSGVWNF
jgi:hypothetical protein